MDDTWTRLKKLRTSQRELALAEVARCRVELERRDSAAMQAQTQVELRREIQMQHASAIRQLLDTGACSTQQLRGAAAWRGALGTRIDEAGQHLAVAKQAVGAQQAEVDQRQLQVRRAHAALEKAVQLERRLLAAERRLAEARSEAQQEDARPPRPAGPPGVAVAADARRSRDM